MRSTADDLDQQLYRDYLAYREQQRGPTPGTIAAGDIYIGENKIELDGANSLIKVNDGKLHLRLGSFSNEAADRTRRS